MAIGCFSRINKRRRRIIAALLVCGGMLSAFAQIDRGIHPIGQGADSGKNRFPTTRAVIIGISNYENDKITDLHYADADALAFADYLKSPAGGQALPENVQVLINQEARQGQIAKALTWLSDESAVGDKAIIYFAGHGDMETLTGMSFLLAHDASATTYSGGGAFPVVFLQSIIGKLTTQKQVSVLLIVDACHSGALAGNEIGGAQATAKVLSDLFSREIKIMSCQPNEFAQEGPQWGGGRGVFSFYLIDALKGLADNNGDGVVTLMETGRYLEEKVPLATAPQVQIPLITGDKSATIALVDAPTLAALQQNAPAAVASRAVVADQQAPIADTTLSGVLASIELAIGNDHLLIPYEGSACQGYGKLKAMPTGERKASRLRLQLAALLQDEAQTAINDYLATDHGELRNRWTHNTRYNHFPEYLGKAAELLGPDHFCYRQLKSREAYFTGLILRLEGERKKDKTFYATARPYQLTSLEYDPNAAFAWNELGLLARRTDEPDSAVLYFKMALDLSPTWVSALTNLSATYIDLSNFDEGERYGLKAVQLNDDYGLAHYNLGVMYHSKRNFPEAEKHYLKTIAVFPDYPLAAFNLGITFYEMSRYTEAKIMFERYIRQVPEDPDGYQNAAEMETLLGDTTQALIQYAKALALNENNHSILIDMSALYISSGNLEEAQRAVDRALTVKENFAPAYVQQARIRASRGDASGSLLCLDKAIGLGFNNRNSVESFPEFGILKPLPGYLKLLEKMSNPRP